MPGSLISKGRDTRSMVPHGKGNRGSLTIIIAEELAEAYLNAYHPGRKFIYMRLLRREDDDQMVLVPTLRPTEEGGRKFCHDSNELDYRICFDGRNYPWIDDIGPFGSTPCEIKIVNPSKGFAGFQFSLPLETMRNPIKGYVFRKRTKKFKRRSPIGSLRRPRPPESPLPLAQKASKLADKWASKWRAHYEEETKKEEEAANTQEMSPAAPPLRLSKLYEVQVPIGQDEAILERILESFAITRGWLWDKD